MSVSYRHYVSADSADFERFAGRLKQHYESQDDPAWANAAYGAAMALYVISDERHGDIKDAGSFFNLWTLRMTSGNAAESEDQ